jgi:hypothetical protein
MLYQWSIHGRNTHSALIMMICAYVALSTDSKRGL